MIYVVPGKQEMQIEADSVDGSSACMWLDIPTSLRLAVAICDCYERPGRYELPRGIVVEDESGRIEIRAGGETVRMCRGCASGLARAIVKACETGSAAKGTCFALN